MKHQLLSTRKQPIRAGFTLVELLAATALALLVMAVVVQVIGQVTGAVNNYRTQVATRTELRGVVEILREDLAGITVNPVPPRPPGKNDGYLEIYEGPFGPIYWPQDPRAPYTLTSEDISGKTDSDSENNNFWDSTLMDYDDIIMFTSRNDRKPFRGLIQSPAGGSSRVVESPAAEVAWFLRGTNLYRRVLLVGPPPVRPQGTNFVEPTIPVWVRDTPGTARYNVPTGVNFYQYNDISVHQEGTNGDPIFRPGTHSEAATQLVANNLGDLTRREYRFAHQPFLWPHVLINGTQNNNSQAFRRDFLGLPTIGEMAPKAGEEWPFPFRVGGSSKVKAYSSPPNAGVTSNGITFNPWINNDLPFDEIDRLTGEMSEYSSFADPSPRSQEDLILKNVLGFDVKVWDPNAPLFYVQPGTPFERILGPGDPIDTNGTPADNSDDSSYLALAVDFLQNGTTTRLAGFGAWVDLNYLSIAGPISVTDASIPLPHFAGPGDTGNSTASETNALLVGEAANTAPGNGARGSTYDTWSTDYIEFDSSQQALMGLASMDSENSGDPVRSTPPPYPYPLRGVKITVRVFDEASRSIDELTVVQDLIVE
ncbi:Hypothetical protein PBC10988_28350 [Planctomycetales bacterium 10988]|nr:Hypothetical protein PBC10988_28350 [Planctomycetales bacterium 10988]